MKKLLFVLAAVAFLALCAFAVDNITTVSPDNGDGPMVPFVPAYGTDVVTWTQTANCTGARRAANGVIGNWYYMFGDQSVCTAQAFNLTTGVWAASTPYTGGYCNIPGVATNDAFYTFGSYTTTYGNQVRKFVPTGGGPTGTWTEMAPYYMALCGSAAAWDRGDYIYVAGGGASANVNTCYRYTISTNTWTQMANMPGLMKYHGGAWANGEFHVMGGTVTPYTQHYAYNPTTNTWSNKATLPQAVGFPLFSTSSNTSGNYIYIVGGGGGYGSWPATNAVQVYDAAADAWALETVWPVSNVGLNQACYANINGTVMSAGGATGGSTNVTTAYKGENFPDGAVVPHDVDINLTYTSGSPVPPGGGNLNYNANIINNETAVVSTDIWTEVTLPNGSMYGPLLNIQNYNIPGSANITRARIQSIPAGAPAGNYTYWGYTGSYPNTVWDDASFTFSKSAGDNSMGKITGWECYGESFEGSMAEHSVYNYKLMSAYPNPFNPTTTIAFSMPEIGQAKITVYDVNGRVVKELLDAYMNAGNHSIGFDGSSLSSGVYFAVLTTEGFTTSQKLLLVK